jgi:hypothetical protein
MSRAIPLRPRVLSCSRCMSTCVMASARLVSTARTVSAGAELMCFSRSAHGDAAGVDS